MDSHKTVSTNHNLSEEKGEPKRYRTEVLPLTKLTPYRRPNRLTLETCDKVGLCTLSDFPARLTARARDRSLLVVAVKRLGFS